MRSFLSKTNSEYFFKKSITAALELSKGRSVTKLKLVAQPKRQ